MEDKLVDDPNFNLPEGFKKEKVKEPVYDFSIPDCAKALIPESKVIATEVMDEIFFDVIGIHFLEPKVSFKIV